MLLHARLAGAGHKVVKEGRAGVVVDVAFAWQNSLLHDGWRWKGFGHFAPRHAQDLIQVARSAGAEHVVVAGFALAEAGPFEDPDLRPALEVEAALRSSDLPLTVLRLGWLYGPRMRNLREYRTAFRLMRPYYGGPRTPQSWLHEEDAAGAFVTAVEQSTPGGPYGVADERPASNREVLDHFAWHVAHRVPISFPRLGLRFSPVREQQALILERTSVVNVARFRKTTAWRPRYRTYVEGMAAVAAAWRSRR
jgi:nucleoside-diphosphate-sugar epimerase